MPENTEQTNTTEVVDAQVDAPVTTEDVGSKQGHEAAKWRTQFRAVVSERDELAGRIEKMQRGEVERIAASKLSVPTDLFVVGRIELDALLDENGNVVPALVDAAVLGMLDARPGLAKVQPRIRDLGQGARSPVDQGSSWSNVIKARR